METLKATQAEALASIEQEIAEVEAELAVVAQQQTALTQSYNHAIAVISERDQAKQERQAAHSVRAGLFEENAKLQDELAGQLRLSDAIEIETLELEKETAKIATLKTQHDANDRQDIVFKHKQALEELEELDAFLKGDCEVEKKALQDDLVKSKETLAAVKREALEVAEEVRAKEASLASHTHIFEDHRANHQGEITKLEEAVKEETERVKTLEQIGKDIDEDLDCPLDVANRTLEVLEYGVPKRQIAESKKAALEAAKARN